jgi:hypothetical protein
MAKRGGSAADSFASDMQSSLGKVETAANDAASAVSNLADEVAALDGSTAVVTVKTHFVTVGSPPSTGGASGSVSFGAVLAAANAGPFGSHGLVKSFAEGGLDTTVGPRMIVFGDNPGGHETHAFIPHDNPFPILRQLAKMFRGKGSASSEIIDRTLDRAGEVIINATFVIENMMDGQKVGTTIARKVFKKMRTR